MIVERSGRTHAEAVEALLAAIERRGLTVFSVIDHAGGACEAGLELAPEKVVVFGNPRAGTLLMQEDPRVGIELPLRMLVWEEEAGTKLGFEDPRALVERYELSEHAAILEQMATLLRELAHEASSPAQD